MPDSTEDPLPGRFGNSVDQQIGMRIGDFRRDADYAVAQLAQATGLGERYLMMVEAGLQRASAMDIFVILKALNISPGSLLEGISEP